MIDRGRMLRTLIAADWRGLARDRVALLLTFVLPIVFFAIFATLFGGMGGSDDGDLRPLRVVAIDRDGSEVSRDLLAALLANDAVEAVDAPAVASDGAAGEDPVSAATALVRAGDADAAVVVESGFAEAFGTFWEEPPRVQLVFDAANPMARFTLEGLVQAASFQAAPVVLMESGFDALEEFGGAMTPAQRMALDTLGELIESQNTAARRDASGAAGVGDADGSAGGMRALIAVDASPATEREDGALGPSIVDYYAAAISVMFLLFSMTGAAGTLLDDEERGTLERLLMSGIGIGPVLVAHWLFFAAIGVAQIAAMFVFAWLVFGLDLVNGQVLVGLSVMSVVTAAAASAFALLLAAACRTRAQLGGLATIVILVMSALGGSMIPRFVMPPFMDTVSHFTFNGWALDGYLAVLWQRDPDGSLVDLLVAIAPSVGVLVVSAVLLLAGARRLARRWETV